MAGARNSGVHAGQTVAHSGRSSPSTSSASFVARRAALGRGGIGCDGTGDGRGTNREAQRGRATCRDLHGLSDLYSARLHQRVVDVDERDLGQRRSRRVEEHERDDRRRCARRGNDLDVWQAVEPLGEARHQLGDEQLAVDGRHRDEALGLVERDRPAGEEPEVGAVRTGNERSQRLRQVGTGQEVTETRGKRLSPRPGVERVAPERIVEDQSAAERRSAEGLGARDRDARPRVEILADQCGRTAALGRVHHDPELIRVPLSPRADPCRAELAHARLRRGHRVHQHLFVALDRMLDVRFDFGLDVERAPDPTVASRSSTSTIATRCPSNPAMSSPGTTRAPSATRVENWRPPAESTVPEPASAAPTRMLRSGRSCAPRTSAETRASVSVPDGVSTMRASASASQPSRATRASVTGARSAAIDGSAPLASNVSRRDARRPIGDGERDAVGWSRGARRAAHDGIEIAQREAVGVSNVARDLAVVSADGEQDFGRVGEDLLGAGELSRRSRLAERARPLVVLRHYAPGPSNRGSRSAKSASSESTAPPRIITPYEEGRAVSVGVPGSVTCSAAARHVVDEGVDDLGVSWKNGEMDRRGRSLRVDPPTLRLEGARERADRQRLRGRGEHAHRRTADRREAGGVGEAVLQPPGRFHHRAREGLVTAPTERGHCRERARRGRDRARAQHSRGRVRAARPTDERVVRRVAQLRVGEQQHGSALGRVAVLVQVDRDARDAGYVDAEAGRLRARGSEEREEQPAHRGIDVHADAPCRGSGRDLHDRIHDAVRVARRGEPHGHGVRIERAEHRVDVGAAVVADLDRDDTEPEIRRGLAECRMRGRRDDDRGRRERGRDRGRP